MKTNNGVKKGNKVNKVSEKAKAADKVKAKKPAGKKAAPSFYTAERAGSRFFELYSRLKNRIIAVGRVYDLTRDSVGTGKEKISFEKILSAKAAIPLNRDTHKALKANGYDIKPVESFKRGARVFVTKLSFVKI